MSTNKHSADTRPHRGRRAVRWTLNLVLFLVVAAGLAWIVPSAFGYSRYVITGPSMTGTYDKGSIVFEKKVPTRDLRVGDVITYLPPANSGVTWLVTHRIHQIQPAAGGGTLYTTKGDHNPTPDPWKFELTSATQPVVRFGVPHAGWVFIALAHRNIRMGVIGVPAGLIALGALAQVVGQLRRRDEDEDVVEIRTGQHWEEPAEDVSARSRIAIPPQRASDELETEELV
jgi:signal peptidase